MNSIESIKETLRIEANTLLGQIDCVGPAFELAVELLHRSQGKVIVTGMGKSGHVGKKMAATFASTGTPSFFLHPGEAYHGDLGMISSNDVVLMLSNFVETDELLKIISFLKENQNSIIAITARPESTLAINADIHLAMWVEHEACPLSLAPTSSTTLTMAIGDALAIALMRAKDFQPDHFARFHPGGALGRKLLAKVEHKMRAVDLPIVHPTSSIVEIINTISKGRLGLTLVNNGEETVGIITDGDLRRLFEAEGIDSWSKVASQIMTQSPRWVSLGTSLHVAEKILQDSKITSLLVVHENGSTAGIIQIYDLIKL